MVWCRTGPACKRCRPGSSFAYDEHGAVAHCTSTRSNVEDDPEVEEQEEESRRRKDAILWCCASAPTRSGCRLDRSVWRHLPHDVLLRVLALLPLRKQLELQTVCKSWRDFFRQGQAPLGTVRETWIVVLRRYAPIYWPDTVTPKLIALCLSPPAPRNNINNNRGRIRWRWSHLPPCAAEAQHLMGSAGGLVVAECTDRDSFVVYNPLTKATKFICRPRVSKAAGFEWILAEMWTLMLVDPSSSFYQVILTSPHLEGYLQVYDSRICNWKVLGAPDSSLFVYDPRSQSWDQDKGHHLKTMATAHHVYNVLDDDLFVLDKQRGAMYTYNAERCMWSTVKTAVPSCLGRLNLALESVVKCKGRILLVGCLELADNYRRRAEGLGVWECKLDVSQGSPTATWVELATTPHHLWEPYRGTRPVDRWCQIRCYVVPENRIIVTGVEYAAEVALNKFWPPLAYDVDCRSWEPLPSCGGGTDYIGYFVLQPSWNAVP